MVTLCLYVLLFASGALPKGHLSVDVSLQRLLWTPGLCRPSSPHTAQHSWACCCQPLPHCSPKQQELPVGGLFCSKGRLTTEAGPEGTCCSLLPLLLWGILMPLLPAPKPGLPCCPSGATAAFGPFCLPAAARVDQSSAALLLSISCWPQQMLTSAFDICLGEELLSVLQFRARPLRSGAALGKSG